MLGPHTHTPAPTARGSRTPTARPVGGQFGEGERLTTDAPHNGGRHPPGDARPPPPQRATPARKGARCGAGAGSHARTNRSRDTRVAEPRPPAPEGGRLGEGQRLTPDAPHNGGRPPPPGTAPHHPRITQPPQGMQAKGTVLGPHHPQARAHSMWMADPSSPPSGRAVRGGGAPDHRRPSQRWRATPQERPSATPTASNAGPQGRTLWGRCWVPRPHRPHPGHTGRGTPAARSRGRATGGGTAPGTRRPSQQWQARLLREGPPPPPRHAALTGHAGQADSVGHPHPHTSAYSTWVADLNGPPSGPAVGGGGAPGLRRPSQRWKAPPRERPSATPIASNAGPQGCTLWGRCWVPMPAPTAAGTHGLWNPGCPPQRTGGWGRDSA